MGWNDPRRFPAPAGYPNRSQSKTLGRYFDENAPGTRDIDFQAYLTWESMVGLCRKQNKISQPGLNTAEDWMDRLLEAAENYNNANPNYPLDLDDLIIAIKDWLIQDGTIYQSAPRPAEPGEPAPLSEVDALAAHFGAPLNTPLTLLPNLLPGGGAEVEERAREFCGALMRTPQFMLTGLEVSGLTELPRLRLLRPPSSEICEHISAGYMGNIECRCTIVR